MKAYYRQCEKCKKLKPYLTYFMSKEKNKILSKEDRLLCYDCYSKKIGGIENMNKGKIKEIMLKKDIKIPAGTIFQCIDGKTVKYAVGNYEVVIEITKDTVGLLCVEFDEENFSYVEKNKLFKRSNDKNNIKGERWRYSEQNTKNR